MDENSATTSMLLNAENAIYDVKSDIRELQKNSVPFIVYEGTIARFERTIRRLIILAGITILLLFASNAIWIYEWNQYDYEDVVVDSQDGGNANYLEAGMNGVINNGKGNGQKTDEEKR